jgi:hypothetical protein
VSYFQPILASGTKVEFRNKYKFNEWHPGVIEDFTGTMYIVRDSSRRRKVKVGDIRFSKEGRIAKILREMDEQEEEKGNE